MGVITSAVASFASFLSSAISLWVVGTISAAVGWWYSCRSEWNELAGYSVQKALEEVRKNIPELRHQVKELLCFFQRPLEKHISELEDTVSSLEKHVNNLHTTLYGSWSLRFAISTPGGLNKRLSHSHKAVEDVIKAIDAVTAHLASAATPGTASDAGSATLPGPSTQCASCVPTASPTSVSRASSVLTSPAGRSPSAVSGIPPPNRSPSLLSASSTAAGPSALPPSPAPSGSLATRLPSNTPDIEPAAEVQPLTELKKQLGALEEALNRTLKRRDRDPQDTAPSKPPAQAPPPPVGHVALLVLPELLGKVLPTGTLQTFVVTTGPALKARGAHEGQCEAAVQTMHQGSTAHVQGAGADPLAASLALSLGSILLTVDELVKFPLTAPAAGANLASLLRALLNRTPALLSKGWSTLQWGRSAVLLRDGAAVARLDGGDGATLPEVPELDAITAEEARRYLPPTAADLVLQAHVGPVCLAMPAPSSSAVPSSSADWDLDLKVGGGKALLALQGGDLQLSVRQGGARIKVPLATSSSGGVAASLPHTFFAERPPPGQGKLQVLDQAGPGLVLLQLLLGDVMSQPVGCLVLPSQWLADEVEQAVAEALAADPKELGDQPAARNAVVCTLGVLLGKAQPERFVDLFPEMEVGSKQFSYLVPAAMWFASAAVHKGWRELASCLLAAPWLLNAPLAKNGGTLLHHAVNVETQPSGRVADAVRWLLERGADVNATDKVGDTSLHCAAMATTEGEHEAFDVMHLEKLAASVPVLAALVAKGANLAATNEAGMTPQQCAAEVDNRLAAAYLAAVSAARAALHHPAVEMSGRPHQGAQPAARKTLSAGESAEIVKEIDRSMDLVDMCIKQMVDMSGVDNDRAELSQMLDQVLATLNSSSAEQLGGAGGSIGGAAGMSAVEVVGAVKALTSSMIDLLHTINNLSHMHAFKRFALAGSIRASLTSVAGGVMGRLQVLQVALNIQHNVIATDLQLADLRQQQDLGDLLRSKIARIHGRQDTAATGGQEDNVQIHALLSKFVGYTLPRSGDKQIIETLVAVAKEVRADKLKEEADFLDSIAELLRQMPSDDPPGFTCPITKVLMTDPVILVGSGKTYERAAIEKWLEKHDTDPLTRTKLVGEEGRRLQPNDELRKEIEVYVRKREAEMAQALRTWREQLSEDEPVAIRRKQLQEQILAKVEELRPQFVGTLGSHAPWDDWATVRRLLKLTRHGLDVDEAEFKTASISELESLAEQLKSRMRAPGDPARWGGSFSKLTFNGREFSCEAPEGSVVELEGLLDVFSHTSGLGVIVQVMLTVEDAAPLTEGGQRRRLQKFAVYDGVPGRLKMNQRVTHNIKGLAVGEYVVCMYVGMYYNATDALANLPEPAAECDPAGFITIVPRGAGSSGAAQHSDPEERKARDKALLGLLENLGRQNNVVALQQAWESPSTWLNDWLAQARAVATSLRQRQLLDQLDHENNAVSPNDPWSGGAPGVSVWLNSWIGQMRSTI